MTLIEQLWEIGRQDPNFDRNMREAQLCDEILMLYYEARTGAGLSKKELAEKAGVDEETISIIEDGGLSELSLGELFAVADALNLRIDFRLEPKDETEDQPRAESA